MNDTTEIIETTTSLIEEWVINVTVPIDDNVTSASYCGYYEYVFHDVFWLVIPMTTILFLILICGIFENICVLLIIIINKSMHTTTNFYLFSLAISDLLYVTCYPVVLISVLWCSPEYPGFCIPCGKLTYLWYSEDLGMDSSSLIVTLFTIERYLAICHPFYGKHLSTQKKRVILLIVAIWIVAICTNLSFYLNKARFGTSRIYILLLFVYYLCFYITPFILITVLCAFMIRNIRKSKKTVRNTQDNSSSDKAFNILGSIVITFFICWMPTYAFLLADKLGLHPSKIREYVNLAITALNCLPAVINPILYSVMSTKFRQAIKDTLSTFSKRLPQQPRKSGASIETISSSV